MLKPKNKLIYNFLNIINMDENVKRISFYIFLSLVFIFIIYMVFLRPSSSSTNKNGKGNNCSHCDLDKNTCDPRIGKCIPKDLCDGKEKPDNACNYTCFKDNKWVCDNYPCLNSYLPDYIDCSIDQLKCDNNYLYCQGVTGCNGGDRYYYGINHTSCICPAGSFGPECKLSNSDCKNEGEMKENGTCTCKDNTFYGDKCESKCSENKIYDNTADPPACICNPLFFDKDGDVCKKKKCVKGLLKDAKCSCDPGYYGDDCSKKICNDNENQIFDEKTSKCICPANIDGTQYYGDDCKEYNCNLAKEFVYDEKTKTPSCDCSKDPDSCGTYCQYTRSNSCNEHGKPNCKDGIFTSCVCDSGWTGTNCQCEEDDKPKDTNQCLGISSICGPKGWEPNNSNCQDLYKSYENENEWSKSCIDKLFPNQFYIQTYKNGSTGTIGTLSCENSTVNKNNQSYICTDTICLHGQGCPSKPIACTGGKVNICDSSIRSNYNWKCFDQLSGECDSASIGNVCKSDNPAECFHCGTLGTTELVCMLDGGTPSIDCIKGLGIEKITPKGYPSGIYIDKSSGGGGLPIYPTTSKKGCSNLFLTKNDTNPYSIQQNIDPKIYSNPVASYDKDTDTLTDLTTNNLYFYPNLESGKDARCILDQTDLMTYLNAPGSTLCNSKGKFIQNTTTNGQFILNPDDKSPGKCVCDPGFAGNNCQFSDNKDCNGQATVDDNGKCGTCKQGFAGKNCQFSDSKDCNGQGKVDINGNCDYTSSCQKKFPRCKTCTNINDYKTMSCSETDNDEILSKDCIPYDPSSIPKQTEYGCPVKKDPFLWSTYIGTACHHDTVDYNSCINGANISQDFTTGNNKMDFCVLDDFTKINNPKLYVSNKDGLNTAVSSPFLENIGGNVVIYDFPNDSTVNYDQNKIINVCKTDNTDFRKNESSRITSLKFGQIGNPNNWQ